MTKLLLRIALLGITLPLLYVLIFLLPHFHHLAFNATVVGVSLIGALEVRGLLREKAKHSVSAPVIILGASLPALAYLITSALLGLELLLAWLAVCFSAVLISAISVSRKAELAGVLQKVAASMLTVVYPGFYLSFIVLMTGWDNAPLKLVFFLSAVFLNDSMAYVFGKIFGRSLNMLVSPRKTLVGFIAGLMASMGVAALFFRLAPGLFSCSLPVLLLFAAGIGVTTILGDLVESALKRSAGVKDSGTIMIGRGGVLDSLDSLMITAPYVFFLLPLLSL